MNATPPKGVGPLARREARLAWKLLSPTLIIVALVVVLPLLAIFWISVKPVGLADLRAPEVRVYERLRGDLLNVGDTGTLQYRVSNSSPKSPITGVSFNDLIPVGRRLLCQNLNLFHGFLDCTDVLFDELHADLVVVNTARNLAVRPALHGPNRQEADGHQNDPNYFLHKRSFL